MRLLAFAVQAEHGSTGEITFGSLRSAFPSSSSSAARTRRPRGSDALAVTSRSHPEPYRDTSWRPPHDARIDGKAFALDQASVHAGSHHRLEHTAQEVAVAEAAVRSEEHMSELQSRE